MIEKSYETEKPGLFRCYRRHAAEIYSRSYPGMFEINERLVRQEISYLAIDGTRIIVLSLRNEDEKEAILETLSMLSEYGGEQESLFWSAERKTGRRGIWFTKEPWKPSTRVASLAFPIMGRHRSLLFTFLGTKSNHVDRDGD